MHINWKWIPQNFKNKVLCLLWVVECELWIFASNSLHFIFFLLLQTEQFYRISE